MSRISRGFHRIGIVLAAPCGIVAAGLFGIALFSTKPADPAIYGGIAMAIGAIIYAVARGIGWAADGFMHPAPAPIEHASPAALNLTATEARPTKEPIFFPKNGIPPKGIYGWLILPVIGTFISPIIVLATSGDLLSLIPKFTTLTGTGKAYVAGAVTANATMLAGYLAGIYGIIKYKSWFPSIYIALAFGSLFAITIDLYIAISFFEAKFTDDDIKSVGRSITNVIVWVPYMLLSKRVKNTFIA